MLMQTSNLSLRDTYYLEIDFNLSTNLLAVPFNTDDSLGDIKIHPVPYII